MELQTQKIKHLIEQAADARRKAYAPYSHFAVGAALLTADGAIYTGCNIENAAFTPGICAERTAVAKAISDGHRDVRAIAIVGGPEADDIGQAGYTAPCGVCRQVLREFANPPECMVILARSAEDYKIYTLEQLLPVSFGPDNLNEIYGGKECE